VNGLFNPKNEENWSAIEALLVTQFDCPAVHVHNPTLALDIEEQADKLKTKVEKSSKWALGAALVGMGAVMLDRYLDTGYTMKVIVATMDTVKEKMTEQAKTVSFQIHKEIAQHCEDHPDLKLINLVAHSHGGWCTKELLEQGLADELAMTFGLKFDVFIMGCPVLVTRTAAVRNVVQLHNALDVISLRYAESSSTNEPYVISSKETPYHGCIEYLSWLSKDWESIEKVLLNTSAINYEKDLKGLI